MKCRHAVFVLIICFSIGGCTFFSSKKRLSVNETAEKPTGQLIRKEAFIEGGTLAVLPFKAGEGALADPQLDRISMMISKGILDYFNAERVPFKVLSTQEEGDPKMVVEGYIEDFDRSGRLSSLGFRPRKMILSVSGQIMVVKNKERILVFKHVRTMVDPQKSGLDLAYQTGQELGRFITDALSGQ